MHFLNLLAGLVATIAAVAIRSEPRSDLTSTSSWSGSLSAPSLRRRQYEDPDGVYDCTTHSYSYPVWRIYDPTWLLPNRTGGGTRGDFWFTAHNEATDEQFECILKDGELFDQVDRVDGPNAGKWHPCRSNPDMQFRFSLETGEFHLRETWSCPESPSLKFTGEKRTVTPYSLGCEEEQLEKGWTTVCFLANVGLEARLLTPVAVQPYLPYPPYGLFMNDLYDNCKEKSPYPAWTVDHLEYSPISSGDETSTKYTLRFGLQNRSNNDTQACVVTVDDMELEKTGKDTWADCGSITDSAINTVFTNVMFNRHYNLLAVNQTWRCPGNDKKSWSGVGFLYAPLTCSTTSAPSSVTLPQYKCALPTTPMTGYNDDTPSTHPHTYYYAKSCTIGSVNSSALAVSNFEVDPLADPIPGFVVASFALTNAGPEDIYEFRRVSLRADGQWHKCEAGLSGPLPWQLVACEYKFGGIEGGEIAFKVQWHCDDRDPEHAILFDITAAGKLDATARPRKVNLERSQFSFRTTPGPMERGPVLMWV